MRIRKTSPNSDHLRNAPPNELLPPDIVKLLDEYRRLFRDHATAHNGWNHLRVHRREDDQVARRQDAAAAAQAARDGKNIEDTPARDALAKWRTKAEQRAHALTDALDAVRRDILNAACEYRATADAIDRFDKARTKLAKAGDAFIAALSTAAAERGVEDWCDGQPFDNSAYFDLAKLTNVATSLGPRVHEAAPVDGFHVVRHLTTLAD